MIIIIQAAALSVVASKYLAKQQFLFNPAIVPSTTQQRDRNSMLERCQPILI